MICLQSRLFFEIAVIYLLLFLRTALSSVQCFSYDSTHPNILMNNTIKCPDPADSCFTVKREDGFVITRSCIWEGHCTETTICGIKSLCQLHCCHTPFCNDASSVSITPVYTLALFLGINLVQIFLNMYDVWYLSEIIYAW
jgi:hypothetical protein